MPCFTKKKFGGCLLGEGADKLCRWGYGLLLQLNETTSCVSWNDNSNDWIANDSKSGDSNDKSVTSQRRGLCLKGSSKEWWNLGLSSKWEGGVRESCEILVAIIFGLENPTFLAKSDKKTDLWGRGGVHLSYVSVTLQWCWWLQWFPWLKFNWKFVTSQHRGLAQRHFQECTFILGAFSVHRKQAQQSRDPVFVSPS